MSNSYSHIGVMKLMKAQNFPWKNIFSSTQKTKQYKFYCPGCTKGFTNKGSLSSHYHFFPCIGPFPPLPNLNSVNGARRLSLINAP